MSTMLYLLVSVIAFAITAALGKWMIPFLHKLKFGQTIREVGPSSTANSAASKPPHSTAWSQSKAKMPPISPAAQPDTGNSSPGSVAKKAAPFSSSGW